MSTARDVGVPFPLEGLWLYQGFPTDIVVLDFPFRRAKWSQRCPGVLAQYRECCRHESMHLKVTKSALTGRLIWTIDHVDRFNPDPDPTKKWWRLRGRGRPLAHFFTDYPPGRTAKPAAVAAVSWGLSRAAGL